MEKARCLATVLDAQLAASVLDMLVDGLRRLAGEFGDFLGLEALADQRQAFPFRGRQAGAPVQ